MTQPRTLAASMRRSEWERVALLLLLGVAAAARKAPPGTIDDVLALLSDTEAGDATDRR
jgi:hypothetical protein